MEVHGVSGREFGVTVLHCRHCRALEHGHRIRVAVIDGWKSVPVDTPDDVERVEAHLESRDASTR